MQVLQDGDQLVLTGPVVAGDLERIRDALDAAPGVGTIILRNSLGGDAPTGYRVGELFRARRLGTAVSGFCISSCSRMFLGGAERAFTDDAPPARTFVGFHGHYDRAGNLMPDYVGALGLETWVRRFTDGKADPALVHRWINIGRANGMASFFPPAVSAAGHPAAMLCDAPAGSRGPLTCETLATNALELGITTTDQIVHSNSRPTPLPMWRASGWAEVTDIGRLPATSERVRAQYLAFLARPVRRAFALSPDGQHFAWRAGFGDPTGPALSACTTASGQPCRLYAVDDAVVWTSP